MALNIPKMQISLHDSYGTPFLPKPIALKALEAKFGSRFVSDWNLDGLSDFETYFVFYKKISLDVILIGIIEKTAMTAFCKHLSPSSTDFAMLFQVSFGSELSDRELKLLTFICGRIEEIRENFMEHFHKIQHFIELIRC